jgi:hypothetical protein
VGDGWVTIGSSNSEALNGSYVIIQFQNKGYSGATFSLIVILTNATKSIFHAIT